jgi:phosphatidylinositol 3-kinase
VELQDQTHGARYREFFSELQRRLSQTPFKMPVLSEPALLVESNDSESLGESGKDSRATSFKSIVDSVSSKLGSSLRGTEQSTSSAESPVRTIPKSVWDVLTSQDQFVSGVMDIQMRSRDTRGKKDAKELNLKSLLAKEGYERNPRRDPIPLPSSPEVMVNGVNPQTAKIFKSAVYPALIEFHVEGVVETNKNSSGRSGSRPKRHTTGKGSLSSSGLHHGSSYKVIVKTGDDLRQDQLVMMMIKLMDGLLKRASLDLCLTPYSIIATSPTSGLVEFVDGSIPVSQILATYNGSILQFFQSCAPQQGSKYNVRPDVISSYVRSCAGYCVITYLLGVGDRHLDNILITNSGNFFHIDFGFMFGRDPKPLPPAFRLTREVRFITRVLYCCELVIVD